MTKLRREPTNISNRVDDVLGPGKRGSSFTNMDGVAHNFDGDRMLMMEFKHEDEQVESPQIWTLEAFSRKPGCESWLLRELRNGRGWHLTIWVDGEVFHDEVVDDESLRAEWLMWWGLSDRLAA